MDTTHIRKFYESAKWKDEDAAEFMRSWMPDLLDEIDRLRKLAQDAVEMNTTLTTTHGVMTEEIDRLRTQAAERTEHIRNIHEVILPRLTEEIRNLQEERDRYKHAIYRARDEIFDYGEYAKAYEILADSLKGDSQ